MVYISLYPYDESYKYIHLCARKSNRKHEIYKKRYSFLMFHFLTHSKVTHKGAPYMCNAHQVTIKEEYIHTDVKEVVRENSQVKMNIEKKGKDVLKKGRR